MCQRTSVDYARPLAGSHHGNAVLITFGGSEISQRDVIWDHGPS